MECSLYDEDTAALVAIIDAEKAGKKSRRRNQRREYYQQDRQAFQYLKVRVKELENELRRLSHMPKSSILSWHDTAHAIGDEAYHSVQQNRILKRRLCEYQNLSRLLNNWVNETIQVSPTGTWCAANLNINHVRLLAHPEARRHGFDWLTQIMYQNTDKLLQKYDFPSRTPYSRLGDIIVDTTNPDSLQYIQRYQVEIPCPLETVVPVAVEYFQTGAPNEQLEVHYKYKRYLDKEMISTVSPCMSYDVVVDLITHWNAGSTRLCRVFQDEHRCVLVTQNIPDDEKLPHKSVASKEMQWVVLERISPTHTIMRCLFVISQGFYLESHLAGTYISLEEEARHDWNLLLKDYAEEDRLDIFTRHVHTLGYRNMQSRDLDMSRLFHFVI